MTNNVIDLDEIPDSYFVRFGKSASNSEREGASKLLNAVPEKVQRALKRKNVEIDDYIVELAGSTVVGSKRVVSFSGKIFLPTTLRRDWKEPPESFEPQGVIDKISGSAQLIAFRWGENYFHWTYQCLAGLLDMLDAGIEVNRLVVTPLNSWRRRTLELAGIDPGDCIEVGREENITFDSILYSSFVSQRSVNRPTKRLIGLFDSFSKNICASNQYGGSDKIYVSRTDASKRRVENEREVCRLVGQYGFDIVQTEKLDIDEQIRLFSGVRHVVAPHGAGLVNLLYAQSCLSVTEILQAGSFNQCMFRICQAKGIQHYSLQAECAKDGVDWRAVSKVDLNVLESHLDELFSNNQPYQENSNVLSCNLKY